MSDSSNTVNNQDIYTLFNSAVQMPAFEGASTDYRNAQRVAYLADADMLAVNELTLLQSRSRHLARNNGVAAAAEDKIVIKLGAVHVVWKTSEGEAHTLMQELWDEWYANPNIDGKGNGDTLQATWNRDRFQSGEAIGRMLIQTRGNSNRIKLKIQAIESEYLDIRYMGQLDPSESQKPFGTTRYGITFDDYNRPAVYHFLAENYFGLHPTTPDLWKRIPVLAEDVIHIFERRRSNQWRGIPVLAPILTNIYELTDLREATVSKQQAAAAISWIIEQADAVTLNPLGSVRTAGKQAEADKDEKIIFRANGGSVQYTNPGDKFHLVQSSDIGNNLTGLIKAELQAIAAAVGIPYYMLANDTDALSFSAIRGILIELQNRLEYIHHFINIPDGLEKIAKKFKAVASLRYDVADAYPTYQFPRNYGVDELKDTQADVLEIQAGLDTYENKLAERNVTKEEIAKSRETVKELGITSLLEVGAASLKGNSQANSQSSSN